MAQTEFRIRDLERPDWADEWMWDHVVEELGELVIARVSGYRVIVCACCNEVHRAPIIEQEECALRWLLQKLGVDVTELDTPKDTASWRA